MTETEQRYRALFENAPAMYVVTRARDASFVVEQCNRCFYDVLGYEPAEVIGQPLTRFLAPDDDGSSPESPPAVLTARDAAIEQALVARDGRILPILAISHPDFGEDQEEPGYLTIFVDNEARNVAETALRESLAHANTLARVALDGVIVCDGAGTITEFNPASEQMLGYWRESALGRNLPEMLYGVSASHGSDDEAIWQRISQGRPLDERFETTVVRADGQRIPVEFTVTRLESSVGPRYVCFMRDISIRVAFEAALRASEERFRGLVQNSYDVITVVNGDGTRAYISPSIERLLGHPPAALQGQEAWSLVHPEDAASFRAAFAACLNGTDQSVSVEVRFKHQDGSWRTFESIATNLLNEPGINGIVFNSRDITARKEAEDALRASEARFRSAFDHAPIGLAIVGLNGQFREVNRSLCALVGFDEDELLALTSTDLTHGEDREDAQERDARLWSGEIDRFAHAMRYIHKGGHAVWVNRTASAVTDSDGTRAAIVQIEDVSTRHQLDLERATMLASERAYARETRELAAMRADLTRMISHELQAPVVAMRMMMSALETGELEPNGQQEMYRAFQGQIDHLDRLVADVAAVSTAERDDFSVQFHDVPLSVLLAGAQAFASKAITLSTDALAAGEQPRVWCDPDRISQVLRNLLDNVARHTPPGTTAELRVTRTGGMLRIEVADDGPGVAVEDQPIIFEKFVRGRAVNDGQPHGAGLGLYVSRQIVNAHGADLTYADRPGGGAVFGFDLRIVQ